MDRDCRPVDARTPLLDFVQQQLLQSGDQCFVVRDDGYVIGLISTRDVAAIPKSRWPSIQVKDAMRPLTGIKSVAPGTSLIDALQAMGSRGIREMPVVRDGELQGVLSRAHILQVLESRAALKV
jgi:CBS domain-containing protein